MARLSRKKKKAKLVGVFMYRGMNREKRILEGEKENGVDSKIPYIWKKKK